MWDTGGEQQKKSLQDFVCFFYTFPKIKRKLTKVLKNQVLW